MSELKPGRLSFSEEKVSFRGFFVGRRLEQTRNKGLIRRRHRFIEIRYSEFSVAERFSLLAEKLSLLMEDESHERQERDD